MVSSKEKGANNSKDSCSNIEYKRNNEQRLDKSNTGRLVTFKKESSDLYNEVDNINKSNETARRRTNKSSPNHYIFGKNNFIDCNHTMNREKSLNFVRFQNNKKGNDITTNYPDHQYLDLNSSGEFPGNFSILSLDNYSQQYYIPRSDILTTVSSWSPLYSNLSSYIPPPPIDGKITNSMYNNLPNIDIPDNDINQIGDMQNKYSFVELSKLLPTSFEVSTANAIQMLIPNHYFYSRISKATSDLCDWLERMNIPLTVYPYGSTTTGFADQYSDLDIALMPSGRLKGQCEKTESHQNSDKLEDNELKYNLCPIKDIDNLSPGALLQELFSLIQKNTASSTISNCNSSADFDSKSSENITHKNLRKIVQNNNEHPFICLQDITSAHVPIIRMLHTSTNVVIDLSITLSESQMKQQKSSNIHKENNQLTTENDIKSFKTGLSHTIPTSISLLQSRLGMLSWYSSLDPRIIHVVVLTKVWTRFRGLRNTLNGFPGGYAWTLCVIYFFQRMGILPVIDADAFYKTTTNSPLSSPSVGPIVNSAITDINSKLRYKLIDEKKMDNYIIARNFPALAIPNNEFLHEKTVCDSNYSQTTEILRNNQSTINEGRLLYLDVVKGSRGNNGINDITLDMEPIESMHNEPYTGINKTIYENLKNNTIEGELTPVGYISSGIKRPYNCKKCEHEVDIVVESGRSSIGSTICTCSFSPGYPFSDNMNSSQCCESTDSFSGLILDGRYCNFCMSNTSSDDTKSGKYSTKKTLPNNTTSHHLEHSHPNFYSNGYPQINNYLHNSTIIGDKNTQHCMILPPCLSDPVLFPDAMLYRHAPSYVLFIRFIQFLETNLWNTVIDISSPDIILSENQGACCDIRNPLPGTPACRPIYDEINQKHIRDEIQRAIQIIASPMGNFAMLCGQVNYDSMGLNRGNSTNLTGNVQVNNKFKFQFSNLNSSPKLNSKQWYKGHFYNPNKVSYFSNKHLSNWNDKQLITVTPLQFPFHIPPPPPPKSPSRVFNNKKYQNFTSAERKLNSSRQNKSALITGCNNSLNISGDSINSTIAKNDYLD
ncbi:uncharacterized protein CMU_005150 [Cryptosporidium muris RN66]|uniref:Poly(A) RNA polymerase mitochondrial-like central palm domain-containing protein n=1 Tax=Cryptosporidium muris (strain RN66) TaxID=441375 RepID=B6AH97_CRYMR|nr:uncharacterized protein CMU_005150 [Cryptosporidium muris RN66]EEA07592.1 hypothetical protein, conserved [Cryptosporidium muris RN66]|eukprot:XP_002141941.1 hypothetical protein [Cryptosporidium muris RN66]